MTTNTNGALARHQGAAAPAVQSTSFVANAKMYWDLSVQLAKADVIPKEFRGKPANVFVAVEMGSRLGIGPMEAMQNLYVVHGTPSMSAKFLIGMANRSGLFKGGLQFRTEGEGAKMAVTCFARNREVGNEISVTVTMAQAERAGWTKNVKYKEMPEQMLSYRAATFLVRRYCPEVTLGMVTTDEAEEMVPRGVMLESSDPLDALLAPVQPAAREELEEEPAPAAAPVYAKPAAVDKMVEAFNKLNINRDDLEGRFGNLDRLDEATFAAACAWGAELRREMEEAAAEAQEDPGGVE